MDYLSAPWRAHYVKSMPQQQGCIFCTHGSKTDDKESLVLFRGTHNFIILNRYPYTPGHLMIAPYRHLASIQDAEKSASDEMMDLLKQSLGILTRHYRPQGFNTGMNLGHAGGAGITDHYHLHLLPRWAGDANFMPIVSETRVFIETLDQTYEQLYPYFHPK